KAGRVDRKDREINSATRRSDRGGYCQGRLELDRNSGLAIARGGKRKAGQTGSAFARARRRSRRGDQSRCQRGASCACRLTGPKSSTWFVYFSRTNRCRQNGIVSRARRISVRRRKRNDPNRHERVYGETHGRETDRCAAGICWL